MSTGGAAPARSAWLTDVNDLPANVHAVTLRAACWYRLRRDDRGAFTRLEVETGRRGLGIAEAAELLPRLTNLGLRTLDIRHAGEKFTADFMPVLRKGVDSLGPLEFVRLPAPGDSEAGRQG